MYPARILSEMRARNDGRPATLPSPVGGDLDEFTIPVKKVKGGGVGKFRHNEGTIEEFVLGTSTGFGGLRDGGINVIIIVKEGGGIEGLKVGGERHVRRRKEREGVGRGTNKGSHRQGQTLNPETI